MIRSCFTCKFGLSLDDKKFGFTFKSKSIIIVQNNHIIKNNQKQSKTIKNNQKYSKINKILKNYQK